MISQFEFINRIQNLPKTIVSKTGSATYTGFKLIGDTLHLKRVNTGKDWKLNVKQLYEVYQSNDFIDTTVVKNATKGRSNSPSLAVLMAIGCITDEGIRI